MKSLDNMILNVVIKGVLPPEVLDKFSDPNDFNRLTLFVKKSIGSSIFYVKFPERFLRVLLFILIIFFRMLELATFKFMAVAPNLKLIAKIHPALENGMRLYILLAMFAAYEDSIMRKELGFSPYKDLVKLFSKSQCE